MKKWLLFSILGLLLVGGGVTFYILSQPPKEKLSKAFKEQAVTKLLGRKAQLDDAFQKTGNEKYDGKYISFEYPAIATIYVFNTPISGAQLERFEFDQKTPKIYSTLQVNANRANITLADDDPAARLRHTQSNLYKEAEITVAGVKGIEFVKKEEGSERSIFWLYKNNIYSFVFYGPDINEIIKASDSVLRTIVLK